MVKKYCAERLILNMDKRELFNPGYINRNQEKRKEAIIAVYK